MATYCKKHGEFELSHICTDCKQYLCIYCTIEHSSKHKINALMELATEVIQQFCREYDENTKIATDINLLHTLIKQRISDYWEDLKFRLCSNIEDFKSDSLKFIEGVIGEKEKQLYMNPKAKDGVLQMFKEKKFYEIYNDKSKLQYTSHRIAEQKRKKELLATLYNSLPSSNFNLEFHNAYLLQLEQNLYSAVDLISNSNYGSYIEENAINLVYVPSYIKTIPLNQTVQNPAIAQAKNSVYLVGGNLGKWNSDHLSTNYLFPLVGGLSSLIPKASMNTCRAWHGIIAFNNQYLYVVGGYNNTDGTLNSCEKYSIEKDKWLKVSPLRKKRWGLSVTLYNNRFIYAFFGVDGRALSTYVESFDCLDEESEWNLLSISDKTSSYARRCHASFQSSNTEILIFGGDSGQQLVAKCLGYNVRKGEMKFAANDCACRPHPTYCCCPGRMKSSAVYKLAIGSQAAVYDMIRKFWIMFELCPLVIKK